MPTSTKIDELQKSATEQLEKVLHDEQHIQSFQSNVKDFMSRYDHHRSLIDRLALFHGNSSWWSHLGIWSGFLGLAVSIGFFLNIMVILPITVGLILAVSSYMLSNHYHVLTHKSAQINQDVKNIESSLEGSVQHLSHVESKLKQVCGSMHALNLHQAEDAAHFQDQVHQFTDEVDALDAFVSSANALKNVFEQHISCMTDSQQALELQCTSLAHVVTRQQSEQQQLADTIGQIDDEANRLSQLNDDFHQYQHNLNTLYQTLKSLADELEAMTAPCEDTLTHSEEVLEQATLFLQQFDREQQSQQSAHERKMHYAAQHMGETADLIKQSESLRTQRHHETSQNASLYSGYYTDF